MVGIFLSHSASDKPFARRLGNDLRGWGARVWIDEAEIKIGDSLIDKISHGIDDTDYLVVLLSRASSASEWVRREVNIAITQEIHGRKVKVLPCLLEDIRMPSFLIDKKYADFRRGHSYLSARGQLLDALGITRQDGEYNFLEQHVFYDLVDLNDGFDVPSIRHFNAEDFAVVLDRVEVLGIGILGIEVFPDGEFGAVNVCEDYGGNSFDPAWYWRAFRELKQKGFRSHFSASYHVPRKLLTTFIKKNR
jgi:hypothetical protein